MPFKFSVPSISLLLGPKIVEIFAKCWRGLQSKTHELALNGAPCVVENYTMFLAHVKIVFFCSAERVVSNFNQKIAKTVQIT